MKRLIAGSVLAVVASVAPMVQLSPIATQVVVDIVGVWT